MFTALTPALKWMIGLTTLVMIGLGVWLGIVVYRHQNQPTATATTELPTPVANGLIESQVAQAPATSAETSASNANQTQTKTKTTTTQTKKISAPQATSETTLAASVATVSMNGKLTITVAANQPVVVGFDPLASSANDYASARTFTVDGFSSARTLVVRTKGGQEQRFQVAGTSTTVTTGAQS